MQLLRALSNNRKLPIFLAVFGFLLLTYFSWMYSRSQISVLDEGLYLYKGILFATGKYTPFQDYGPWTNQMPLAFLLPGWVELLFGAGIATGRVMAFCLILGSVAGLWLIVRRIGGDWAAAGAVITLAANPAALKIYAVATSQGLTTFLLVWCLFFTLGKERKTWELFLGGLLAAMVVMVRINMLPLLPLTILYVCWEKNWRAALFHVAGIACLIGGIHFAYWPNILKIWAKWLPLSFLKPWAPPKNISTWNPDNPMGFRLASFFLAFRFHWAALGGSIIAWSLVSRQKLTEHGKWKIFIFLSTSLLALFAIHVWASLLNDYCVFCFPTYSAFFCSIGLILFFASLMYMDGTSSLVRKVAGFTSLAIILLGITYSAEDSILALAGNDVYKVFLNIQTPLSGHPMLWQVIANKMMLDKIAVTKLIHTWLPVSTLLGILFLTVVVVLLLNKRKGVGKGIVASLIFFFCVGLALTPTELMSGFYQAYDCPIEVIDAYQKTGEELSAIIPDGSRVYWAGYSPVTLTYLPNVTIYPAQLHGGYSYRISKEDYQLLKYGWWNEQLKNKWLNEADFLLLSQDNETDLAPTLANDGHYTLIYESGPQSCKENSTLALYRRK